MKPLYFLLALFISIIGCNSKKEQKDLIEGDKHGVSRFVHEDYIMEKPHSKPDAVLVLFGGYPETAADVEREFNILKVAPLENIAVVITNYNRKLWFEKGELESLGQHIHRILDRHQLPKENLYFGGFSSGGVVSLFLADHLAEDSSKGFLAKGVFIVDSPIDLAELYFTSEMNIEKDFSKPSVDESTWLINTLGKRFGNPHENIIPYEQHAIYTHKTDHIDNIGNLKEIKIRFYTEPDTLWWKENRRTDYQQTNAFLIEQLSQRLKEQGFSKVEYIATENKGYRSNGHRHPHSWSIVNIDDLIYWIKTD